VKKRERPDPGAPVVTCPHCGGPAVFAPTNRYRPFCSERCKMIDLGAWANDQYAVPGDPVDDGTMTDAGRET
jgi:uncharacterized protein